MFLPWFDLSFCKKLKKQKRNIWVCNLLCLLLREKRNEGVNFALYTSGEQCCMKNINNNKSNKKQNNDYYCFMRYLLLFLLSSVRFSERSTHTWNDILVVHVNFWLVDYFCVLTSFTTFSCGTRTHLNSCININNNQFNNLIDSNYKK